MTKTHSFACSGATALLFAFGLGCTAGVKPTLTGTAGTGSGTAGISGGAGTSGGGTTGVGTGGVGNTGFDASFDISTADSKNDGVCAATMTAAEPLPLDLYVTVDLSNRWR